MTLRARAWLHRWGPILPLLIAEATVWLGFGALLPILPIYFTEHGVDLPTLGVVVAAWPAARLVGEPAFGWMADRASRKLLMVLGLALASILAVLPLYLVGPVAFIVLRALSGMAAAMYDPAARGYLTDANPPERHGEAFGLYGAAQMGGLMLGPAVGGVAAAVTAQPTVVFWVAGLSLAVSGALVWWRVPDLAPLPRAVPDAAGEGGEGPSGAASEAPAPDGGGVRPTRLLNLLLLAAIVLNVGTYFAGGTYEVIWSLYLTSLGAGLDVIGFTFFSFAVPIIVLSPPVGRYVDRRGGLLPLVLGMATVGVCGALYPLVPEVWYVVVLGVIEGIGFALASPAMFLLVARAAPPGRSSSAQGIFGAAGTIGTIVASLAAGTLADLDLRYPFWATGVVALVALAVGLAIGRRRLYLAMQARPEGTSPDGPGLPEGRGPALPERAG